MDNIPESSGIQRGSNLNSDGERFFYGQRRRLQTFVKSRSFTILHCDESGTVFLTDFMDDTDIGMMKRSGSARFALKALYRNGIVVVMATPSRTAEAMRWMAK